MRKRKSSVKDAPEHPRWIATVTYRSERGPIDIDHHFEELDELWDLIERGPNWNALVEIKVILNPRRSTYAGLTVERAATLTVNDLKKEWDRQNREGSGG
jgi:hypothetical protein